MDSNALVVRKLSQANPQAKFICITTSIEDRQGLMSENAYVVYRFPGTAKGISCIIGVRPTSLHKHRDQAGFKQRKNQ
jgi:hypothetical protein